MNKTNYVDFTQYKIVNKKDYSILKNSSYDKKGELIITKNLKTGAIKYRVSNEYYDILLKLKESTYSITKYEYSLLLKNSNKENAFFAKISNNSYYQFHCKYLYVANREAYEELQHITKSIHGE